MSGAPECEIPALPMWQMACEMIPVLLKIPYNQDTFERLTNIIKSQNIFVYSRDPTVQFELYRGIAEKYESFTTWILGQFFFTLSCNKSERIHAVFIEAQLGVLGHLLKTQPHVYREMVLKYGAALHQLVEFLKKDNEEQVKLDVFVARELPEVALDLNSAPIVLTKKNCFEFVLRFVKLFRSILARDASLSNFRFAYENTTDLLFLLTEGPVSVKFEVLEMFRLLMSCHNKEYFSRAFSQFGSHFEQFVYEVYDEKVDGLSKDDLREFEKILARLAPLLSAEVLGRLVLYLGVTSSGASRKFPQELLLNIARNAEIKIVKAHNLDCIENYDVATLLCVTREAGNDICTCIRRLNGSSRAPVPYGRPDDEIEVWTVSPKWANLHENLMEYLKRAMVCKENSCKLEDFLRLIKVVLKMTSEVRIRMAKTSRSLTFFNEKEFFIIFLDMFNWHFRHCGKSTSDIEKAFELFSKFPLIATSLTADIANIFYFAISGQHPPRGTEANMYYSKVPSEFYEVLPTLVFEKAMSWKYLNRFMVVLTSGFSSSAGVFKSKSETQYVHMTKEVMADEREDELQCLIVENAGHFLTVFSDKDWVIDYIVIPALTSSNPAVLRKVTALLPTIICVISSEFWKVTKLDAEDELQMTTVCKKCNSLIETADPVFVEESPQVEVEDLAKLIGAVLKSLTRSLTFDDAEVRAAALEALPACSNHILTFHSMSLTRIWILKSDDTSTCVRKTFSKIVGRTVRYGQNNPVLSQAVKDEIIEVVFSFLLGLTKKSLQQSDYQVQDTVLEAVKSLSDIGAKAALLYNIKMLLYFIMVPTSKYWYVAVNNFVTMAEKHGWTCRQLYMRYKKEICEVIVHLCAVNQALLGWSLSQSLDKVATTLEYYSYKQFVAHECKHLLPFFVWKVIKMPAVGSLIEQIATVTDSDLAELLTTKYGHIFVHVFLNESKEDFKKCTAYLESSTGLSGCALRQRNFRVILNELLLNFRPKRDQVLLALSLLAQEDARANSTGATLITVQNYLQSHFLGSLQHFDFKLTSKTSSRKDVVLKSLADLFRYMGPRHVGPSRFKIIAMLRSTSDCGGFPELSCEVWDAFVRSCDVESLGPQLATIFVSILPLARHCPDKVNSILEYLIVENEASMKDYIGDLFFAENVEGRISVVIDKYVGNLKDRPLKDNVQTFLRYLTHETMEVRLLSMKKLKVVMEASREQLDSMILGYNGIDPTIVELIDVLTSGCRERDDSLKLACAEVIGELGAVEPSHLPRRYAQNNRHFTFSMEDDAFIVTILNDLTRVFQGEKNTHNMDRFALAIQEILKAYAVSPEAGSLRNHLWSQFPEPQQQLMLPLLSSKYIIKQPVSSNFPTPIFGTSLGTSLKSWLYNWTCSLIASLPQEGHRSLMMHCLPAMKNDHRVLMNFLPYIMLHCLVESGSTAAENLFLEIQEVTNCFVDRKVADIESFNVRPFPNPNAVATLETITPEEVKKTQCTKVVFVILDFLDRWLREWQWQKGLEGRKGDSYVKIKAFLNRFCKLKLAECNYHCGEYPRALLYLEDHVASHPEEISQHLSFLAEIYAHLEEADGVTGVATLRHTEPPIEDRILALTVSGKLSDAASCFERMAQPLKLHHLRGLVQCYLDLDNVNTALNFAQGALDRQVEFGNTLLEMQAEPLWRLGRYEDLEELLNRPEMIDETGWEVQVGRALLSFRSGDRDRFSEVLDGLKGQQVKLFGAASLEEGSYQHGYFYITRLHALNELQKVEKATYEALIKPNDRTFVKEVFNALSREFELRTKVVQESLRVVEPLLCLRRVALEQSKRVLEGRAPQAVESIKSLLGECWLQSARTARAAGVHQQAYTYTLKAEEYAPPKLFLEKAKLHWLREEHEQAFTTLKRGLEVIIAQPSKEALAALPVEERRTYAEAKLLIASYNDAISNVDTDANIANYRESTDAFKEWEKSLVCLAQFYDRIYQSFNEDERDSKGSDIQLHMINTFGKSLLYGTTYVYQSMPRLLSIWFDYGTRLLDVKEGSVRDSRKATLLKMTKLIDGFLDRLSPYIFLTALSQLVSRICHPQREVYIELKSIIIKLLLNYPQQTLWMIISVIKSSYSVRAKRCSEILTDSRLKIAAMTKLVRDFTSLAEKLIELCNKEVPADVNTTTVSALLRALPRMLSKGDFSEIMIPTHKFRKLVLPNPDFVSSSSHNPFPNHYVHIVGIDEEVTLLRSLQRPRKITFRGSDGKGYVQMLKPKDDLRKDFRLMEFNDIVNQLLSCEPEARQRRLNIRLYSVAPLNEECGLIEWIPNLVCLRPVVMSIYQQRGLGMSPRELKDVSGNIRDPLAKKRDVYLKKLLPKHPPVLGEWFRRTFPDAQSWVVARTAYIRTTAVISMVGYILGLGDRHGENILLDSVCGDTVHVDFNCLFNKGETFEWPEKVPFRLTHNMVAAMGPLGVEGVFRKSCATTLRVLRTNSNTLMSIVTPFVYDPLLSWPKNVPATSHANNAERTNEQALDHIRNIKTRLQGVLKTKSRSLSIPLSVDGQTNSLIEEAMSVDNLCQMYIGWGPQL